MKDEALVQFKLMLPAGLKTRVESSAAKNRRSLSQEIVAVLEEKFPAEAFSLDTFWRQWVQPAMAEDDLKRRLEIIQEADHILWNEAPHLSLWFDKNQILEHGGVVFGSRSNCRMDRVFGELPPEKRFADNIRVKKPIIGN